MNLATALADKYSLPHTIAYDVGVTQAARFEIEEAGTVWELAYSWLGLDLDRWLRWLVCNATRAHAKSLALGFGLTRTDVAMAHAKFCTL